jgi:hypothetical protein
MQLGVSRSCVAQRQQAAEMTAAAAAMASEPLSSGLLGEGLSADRGDGGLNLICSDNGLMAGSDGGDPSAAAAAAAAAFNCFR